MIRWGGTMGSDYLAVLAVLKIGWLCTRFEWGSIIIILIDIIYINSSLCFIISTESL